MNRTCRIVISVALGAWLLVAVGHAQTSNLADSIASYEQQLAQARGEKNTRQVVTELNVLGSLYRQAGQLQKALTYLNEALPIEQRAASLYGQATTLDTMGRIYTDLGQEDKALSLLNQALPMWRALGQRTGEADALSYIGKVYNNLGQHDEALKVLNQSMAIWQAIDDPASANSAASSTPQPSPSTGSGRSNVSVAGEAGTLDNLGRTYFNEGQSFDALKYFNRALPLYNQINERGGEALVLNDMGPAFASVGQKQKALESYNKALAIVREIGSRQGEALTLESMGWLYRDLSQNQTALDYYNQALPIWREVGNRSGEARALSDIGRAYADLGQPQKALDYAAQALPIFRETGSRRGEAMTLNNMGRDDTDLHETGDAMKLDFQALAIWRETKDQRNEASCLMTLAWAYSQMKQPETSLASALAALYLAKSTGDPQIEGGVETSMMLGFRKQNHPQEAIFFGLDAVNAYEQIRRNITGLDKELQAGYAASRAGAYRMLAELLVESDRLGQAEQILDLLKEQELKDAVSGATASASAGIEPLKLSPEQQKAEAQLPDVEQKARAVEEDTLAYAEIQAKPTRTPDEDAQLKTLQAKIQMEVASIRSALTDTIYSALDEQSAPGAAGVDTTQSYLQGSLAKLGSNVVGIRLLLGDDHAYAIVVTSTTRKKIVLQASSADVRNKSFEVLKAIGSPATDPRPQLNQLYDMIVAPLEPDLKRMETTAQSGVPTLLWSLDDALRYVPISALYDGHHYMVERFHNVLFTPESYGHMTDAPLGNGDTPSALAMGLSKSYGGMPALPGVIPELDSVVHDPAVPDSHGPMQGKLLPDDQFTLAALKTELGTGKGFPVVHIASHFVLVAGSGDEPFLMMGGENAGNANGFAWNLSEMENSSVAFHGTRLLTLSACSTAKDYKSRNGFEMDSLGMVAQQKDAEAVLATLWDVNDLSTSHIMSDFYDRWVRNPTQGKAEALRQAQLAFLHGTAVTPEAKTGRGFETEDGATAATSSLGYAHPYYWAPFVLIGNYQ
jgi:CHAT domain-containing protein/predicted negative regulator of RcsB-dependent stress response